MLNIRIIKWTGRLGNNVVQLANAVWLAKTIKTNIVYIPPHPILKISSLHQRYLVHNPQIINNKNFFDAKLFDIKDAKSLTNKRPTHADYYEIFQNIIYNILPDNIKSSKPLDNDTLVIHVRSGDCFKETTSQPHRLYVPLPLSYFKKVIIDSYAKRYWKTILVVTESDRVNPVIDELGVWLNKEYPMIQYRVQSSDLQTDMITILSAKHLVLSIGFFSKILAMLSKHLKCIYYCDRLYEDRLFEDKSCVYYKIDNYTKQGDWTDSIDQRKLITSHSLENISLLHEHTFYNLN